MKAKNKDNETPLDGMLKSILNKSTDPQTKKARIDWVGKWL